ncbi:hypothetical protein HOP51_05045 [Halomonas sp. MCCC 1A11036]|uniref:Uncharacterized protein n=1 Tax=Billgrantia zhangzhouensis TaxID=2733481 RepID=A0ABS9AC52_9GAMM|nr:hypothetical protein [Halomonas zhangzhouensis]MCE8019490.1 hypothetical protein [Halomonas zhangzhouensis]
MIRLTWKAGSKFLDDKGPGFAIMLFVAFMSWILFWPHGLSMNMAAGMGPEAIRYEKVSTSYSQNAAELMRSNEEVFSRSLSILDTKKYHCLLTEFLSRGEQEGSQSASLARYETLCGIFTDAAAMVDTYAERLGGGGGYYPELHEFTLHTQGRERAIGPFLTQGECIKIANRLARAGEHTSHCLPYGQARHPTPGLGRG